MFWPSLCPDGSHLAKCVTDWVGIPEFISGLKLIQKVKPLSYTRARESILNLLKEFVPDSANISLHSFRAGGATTAANAHVSDRCWKRHGRWQSESAKDGYVEDSIDHRLLVSKSLGI